MVKLHGFPAVVVVYLKLHFSINNAIGTLCNKYEEPGLFFVFALSLLQERAYCSFTLK